MNLIPRDSWFDIDKFFDNLPWHPARTAELGGTWAPRVDIHESDNSYEISADLPGVKKEDINVTLNDNVLTIEAETQTQEKEEKEGKVIRQERRYGKFMRSFSLAGNIQESDIQANFKDGVLSLSVPKTEPASPPSRRIEIS